jgi:hypothetical protein
MAAGRAKIGLQLQRMLQGLRCQVVVGEVAGLAALLDVGVAQLIVDRGVVRAHPEDFLADDYCAVDGIPAGIIAKGRRREP